MDYQMSGNTQYMMWRKIQMSSTVVIYLDFERDDIDDIDVYEYLNELMENNNLDWEIGTTCRI